MYSSRGCAENRCVSTPARKGPTWSHVPWRAGQGLFCFFSVRTCSTICPFRDRQTKMKHNKSKTNKLTAAASQKPQEYVFSNLPVPGIQGQTEMKHTKFKSNRLTTAAWTKAENHKTSKKGFTWGGSDGVDHVAREVLQIGAPHKYVHAPSLSGLVAPSLVHCFISPSMVGRLRSPLALLMFPYQGCCVLRHNLSIFPTVPPNTLEYTRSTKFLI